jgi:hypothetical protein
MERLLDYPEIRNNFNIEKHLEKVIAEAYGIVQAKKGMTTLELKEGSKYHARILANNIIDHIYSEMELFRIRIDELWKDEVEI